MIDLVVITGIQGAGKTLTLYNFEENGYYVCDNVPLDVVPALLDTFIKDQKKYAKVAVAVSLENAEKTYELTKNYGDFNIKFLGLDCDKNELLSRYRLSRKKHPSESHGESLEKAIDNEKETMKSLRLLFTNYIDTTKLTKDELRRHLIATMMCGKGIDFLVTFVSFGYKVAVPQDIETVFDVRLLPNPYWDKKLRPLTGKDEAIKKFVLDNPTTQEYLKQVISYLTYYLNNLRASERNHANIGIACSGGQHRSVVIAEYLADYFSKDFYTEVIHKDLPNKDK